MGARVRVDKWWMSAISCGEAPERALSDNLVSDFLHSGVRLP